MADLSRLVGRNVKRIRQQKGLKQAELAELSGYSQQYISLLERGLRDPTVATLEVLARCLGVSHVDLVQPNTRDDSF
jgi:transcriptional regulator with XRE-family HTH domain